MAAWEDPYDINCEERIDRRPAAQAHQHYQRRFCASAYKPMEVDVLRSRLTSASLISGLFRGTASHQYQLVPVGACHILRCPSWRSAPRTR